MIVGKFAGLDVFIREDVPKMQLSDGCPVSPEFRVEMNAWMREFFGLVSVIPDGQYWVIAERQVHMNPRTFQRLRAATLPRLDDL